MTRLIDINEAQTLIKEGKVVAYPTEGVYGIGCDPFQKNAVTTLLELKQRPATQGLILLISNWEQLSILIKPLSDIQLQKLHQTWPGFVTWVLPKSNLIPSWVSGMHETVAIRMTAHPIAYALCKNQPIISTSANRSGLSPAKTPAEIENQFPYGLGGIVKGQLGGEQRSSPIYDLNGTIFR